MSNINHRLEKVFKYEGTEVPVIKYNDEIWFKAVAVATILKYKNRKYGDNLTFKIENETDLHTKVFSFSKKGYPQSIFIATLGQNQDTCNKRIESYKKGYLRGSPDLIINNLHKHFTGFAIEFKNPNSKGVLFCHMISV